MIKIGSLIIPMLVEAWAAGGAATSRKDVPRLSPDYKTAMAASVLGSRNTPGVFEKTEPLEAGVHLHFILPDAFTHSEDGEQYPAVPNRYVVTRLWYDAGVKKMNSKCCVVESDYITTDRAYSKSVTIPFFTDPDERKRWRYLGRTYPAEQLAQKGAPENYLEELTAMGAGDPLFSAYYPSCRSVFGFYDDLKDIPQAAATKLTYFVMGYFSEEAEDPFSDVTDRDSFAAVLERHKLSVSSAEEACSSCVLYGAVDAVEWKGYGAEYGNCPQGKVNVVFGNTSAEALSCTIRNTLEGGEGLTERMLNALQYELYGEEDRFDGNFKIDDEIHKNTFNGADSLEDSPLLSANKNEAPNERIWEKYAGLKELGAETGQLMRELAYEQKRLYCVWEQYILLYEDESKETGERPGRNEMQDELENICSRIEQMKEALLKKKEVYKSDMKALSVELTDGTNLTRGGGQPFYEPKEPVLLMSGPGILRSYAFGEDGRFTGDGTLLCQSAAVTSTANKEDIFDCCFGGLAYMENLRPDYSELLFQTLLLCPEMKEHITETVGELDILGEGPCEIALNRKPFEWTTLFMQWGADYFPTRTAKDADNTLAGWVFEYGDTNLVYKGGLQPEQLERHSVSGKVLLTPHAVAAFGNVVGRYAQLYGDDEELKALAEQIRDFPVISQNMSGFSGYFSGLWPALQFPVMGIGDSGEITERVARHVDHERWSILPESELLPLRGGYVKITDMILVSSFGQTQVLI